LGLAFSGRLATPQAAATELNQFKKVRRDRFASILVFLSKYFSST
jgi:hypothetical protein